MAKKNTDPTLKTTLADALKSPICRRIGLITLVVALSVDLAIVALSFVDKRAHFERELHDRAVTYVLSAVDATTFPNIDRLVRFGENLSAVTAVEGGIYVNSIGEEAGQFGNRPWLTWSSATLRRTPWVLDDNGQYYDTFIRPAETGLSYGLIVRMDVGDAWAGLMREVYLTVLAAIVAAFVIALLAFLTTAVLVLRPIDAINRAVTQALHAPEKAASNVAQIRTENEFGDVGRKLDQLLFLLGNTYTEDLAIASAISEQIPSANLIFSEEGHLLSANAAALRLFQVETFEELALQQETGFVWVQGKSRIASDLIKRGRFYGPAEALVAGEKVPCLIGGDRVLHADGSIARYFLMMVDVRTFVSDMRRERAQRRVVEDSLGAARRRIEELEEKIVAHQVVAGLATLGQQADGAESTYTIRPDMIVTKWMTEARAHGKVSPDMTTHERLPPVRVRMQGAEQVFILALSVVRMRSGESSPVIDFAGGLESMSEAVFRVREQKKTGFVGETELQGRDADVSAQLSAIARVVQAEGGRVLAAETGEGLPNQLVFSMPADVNMIRRMDGQFRNGVLSEFGLETAA